MIKIKNPSFVKEVLKRKLVSAKELERFLNKEPDNDYKFMQYIIRQGIMGREEVASLWATSLGVAWINLNKSLFQPEVVSIIPAAQAKELLAIPVYKMGDAVTVAMVDPSDKKNLAKFEKLTKTKISPVFASYEDITEAIELQSHTTQELEALGEKLEILTLSPEEAVSKEDIKKLTGDETIVNFTRALLLLAVKEEASDIHIEPMEGRTIIRLRIDGILHHRLTMASDVMPAIISRIKIMSGMDITERRRPQDGRLSIDLGATAIGFRTSVIPTVSGEKIVLRKLGEMKKRAVPRLEDLELSRKTYQEIKNLVHSPSGSFFITGPTGSGKTTTLYSALQFINNSGINIMTVEDPVEYRLAGINQTQVNHEIGLDFSTSLRSMLRQDPDVILIGEIRDLETAKISTEAALTGHLVLASMHTNDAVQAVTRLVEIGVEPFLVGPSLIGVMSQRLVRRICDQCKVSYTPDKSLLDELFEDSDERPAVEFSRGKGCSACGNTGFHGRIGIYEMLMVGPEIRKLVISNAPIDQIYSTAYAEGFKSMRYDGIKKVLRGLTTIEEVTRVAP